MTTLKRIDWQKIKSVLIKPDPEKPKPTTFKGKVIENVKSFGWALIVALLIKTFVIEATTVPTGSMENTILPGDFLFINKFIYGAEIPFIRKHLPRFRRPEAGDIIVFRFPQDQEMNFVKRCVAVAGDTIIIKNKQLYINSEHRPLPDNGKFSDPNVYPHNYTVRDNYGPYIVPSNHYFAMGDNRDNSNDSRFWGPVPDSLLKGKALIIYWSWNKEIPFYDIYRKIMSIRFRRIGKIVY